MANLGAEVLADVRAAINAKLIEMDEYVDNELLDSIMSMVANDRTKEQMEEDLGVTLNENTVPFTTWLHCYLENLGKAGSLEVASSEAGPADSSSTSGHKRVKRRGAEAEAGPRQKKIRRSFLEASKNTLVAEISREDGMTLRHEDVMDIQNKFAHLIVDGDSVDGQEWEPVRIKAVSIRYGKIRLACCDSYTFKWVSEKVPTLETRHIGSKYCVQVADKKDFVPFIVRVPGFFARNHAGFERLIRILNPQLAKGEIKVTGSLPDIGNDKEAHLLMVKVQDNLLPILEEMEYCVKIVIGIVFFKKMHHNTTVGSDQPE